MLQMVNRLNIKQKCWKKQKHSLEMKEMQIDQKNQLQMLKSLFHSIILVIFGDFLIYH